MKIEMGKLYQNIIKTLSNVQDLPLLFIRLVLAYGFFTPAKMKWNDIHSISGWFESMDYPLPVLNAYLAASAEAAGVVLLTLGLFSRIISIPLIVTMILAIFTVHLENGFNSGDNGFEIPLYYLIMLLTIVVFGPGRISLDNFLIKAEKENRRV